MLIPCDRHSAEDLAHWRKLSAIDAMRARRDRRRLDAQARESARHMRAFLADGPCYLGVSWGKDSVVLAHLAALNGLDVPRVHVHAPGYETPFNGLVRDAFFARFPCADYHEIACAVTADGGAEERHAAGYAVASARFGDRYISGVRADESYARTMRLYGHGISSARTCAPLSRWRGEDVFAWCALHNLPLHPSYAMTMGGRLDRAQLRVSSVGHMRGVARGQREWEWRYYRPELLAQGLTRTP